MKAHLGIQRARQRDRAGAVMAEAALCLIPLLFFLLLSPGIITIWVNEQDARTEAHRDMFDKTAGMFLISEPFTSQATTFQRRRTMPGFPPDNSTWPSSMQWVGPDDDPREATLGWLGAQEIFPDGFPNQFVEGWKYVPPFQYQGGWWSGQMDVMRYAATVRSPWTMLGWPFAPSQDMYWEPSQVQAWYGDQGVDDTVKARLHLMD